MHTWTFDGRNARGMALNDRAYRVRLVARTDGRTWRSTWRNLTIARRLVAGRLTTDWSTVYPRTTAVRDTVDIAHVSRSGRRPHPGRVKIFNADGEKVAAWREEANRRTHTWDARLDGQPLPAGPYDVATGR